MVWDELECRVKEKKPTSAQNMCELQVKLVERMPRVCKAVIKTKGGYFEESQTCILIYITPFWSLYDSICVIS